MTRRKQTKGQCVYCQQALTKSGMTKHLPSCVSRQAAIAQANAAGKQPERLYHLRVQDAWGGMFWLDLEMKGDAKLKDLDSYLRAIWLECCGHMSEFSVGGWGGQKFGMARSIEQVFQAAPELIHIYDFGTSSETKISVVASRDGAPLTRKPIVLLARNLIPETECLECQAPAAWFCQECLEEEQTGMLCDQCVKDHPHDNYGEPVKIVNSPRLGMCGYDGPADPPY